DCLIYHFDAYRLGSELEFRQLDPDNYFESSGITFIEWGDKFPQILPKERLQIQIKITGDTSRQYQIKSHGKKFDQIINSIKPLIKSITK
ncbi:MAG: tRNA (adenosine(37)-N6)-threonylcarbamoyltransferase complex ATPase subunit type 1 TsaE, partial [Planctomycetaceae bacterium]|nr:tRNA (adenosine(37)-N6)-threonylcarbamoyltransferase complex ATPase subunit type 1 TsaE [Planctomycetaceae bacterium]